MTKTKVNLIWSIVESVALVLGPALFILHMASFRVDKYGIYYEESAEWGMAAGVLLISTIFVARLWRKQ